MGLVGMAFSTGLGVLWVIPAGLLGYALNWGLVARRIRERSASDGFATFPGFLSSGYASRISAVIRLLTSVIILIFLTYYVSGQFNAAGKALRTFFDMPYEWGVLGALAISLPYVVVAGMRGTSWSDVVQATLIAVAVIFVPIAALMHIGGIGNMFSDLRGIDPSMVSLTSGKTGLTPLSILCFGFRLVWPYRDSRKSLLVSWRQRTTAVTRGRWIAVGWFLLVSTMAVLAGLTARVGFADEPAIMQDSEQIIPALAAMFLPFLLVGVVPAASLRQSCQRPIQWSLSCSQPCWRTFVVSKLKAQAFSIATRIALERLSLQQPPQLRSYPKEKFLPSSLKLGRF